MVMFKSKKGSTVFGASAVFAHTTYKQTSSALISFNVPQHRLEDSFSTTGGWIKAHTRILTDTMIDMVNWTNYLLGSYYRGQ